MKSTHAKVMIGVVVALLGAYAGLWWYVYRINDGIPVLSGEAKEWVGGDAPDFQPIDTKTIAAYEKLGAVQGHWWSNEVP